MRRRYQRFARNTYRFLRNRKRRRENRFFAWLGRRVLNRDFWKPDRHAMAIGLAIGMAVSMLPPIPVQMLIAAVIAVLMRANIPMAAAACWVSNPVSWGPILILQRTIGDWMLPQSAFDELHPTYHVLRCTALGAVVMAVVLAPLGYFLVYVLWDLISKLLGFTVPLAKKKIEPLVKPIAEKHAHKKAAKDADVPANRKIAAAASQPEP
ncbi:MAG: hypothetical protein ACI9UA_004603 [Pseudoalteromonas tetraodonis]|jgi:uncharacterized protein (DUF2062 family)